MNETVAVEYAQLFGLTSTGKTKVWQVSVLALEDGTAVIDQEYGELDGKLQTNHKVVREGKNLGKANATNPLQQAIAEAESKLKKKLEQEGYSEDKDKLSIPEFPMLAQTFNNAKHRIKWPAGVQAKINGVRCFVKKLSETKVEYKSKKGKLYTTLEHLTPALLKIMKTGEIWDGEVYCHGMPLQRIGAAVKKMKPDTTNLEFWNYDIADKTMDFCERYRKYNSAKDVPGVVKVEVYYANNEEEVYKIHDELVAKDFEGCIVRNMVCGGYDFKHRSKNLQKYKIFLDDEFQIVGGYTGDGTSFEGQVTFVCKTKDNKEFGVVPKGTKAYREKLWKDIDKIVAARTLLTVKFLEYSDEGLPIGNTVGVAIRDYE